MAKCNICDQEMGRGVSCVQLDVENASGEMLPPVPVYGDTNCYDCKAPPGGFHHAGCDTEECPFCGFEVVSCGCLENQSDEDLEDSLRDGDEDL